MKAMINNRKDILLLLLYSPGQSKQKNEPITGRTRLTKMIFLFQKEWFSLFKRDIHLQDEEFYNFFPWNYGPFSKEVYEDLTFFTLRDFIREDNADEDTTPEAASEWSQWISTTEEQESSTEYSEAAFSLTEKGSKFTKNMYDNLSNDQKNILEKFKTETQKLSLRALLKYVYSKYPDYTTKSKIKDDILP
ncbi:hypothetical protein J0M44_27615 [Pseudomonas aeruginosa]|uniref:type II toxin-antitoxin system antitoxin SocA domain-containing protein n=2 Tax=Pseudomonas aeruginosa TaxID=287 RepID=UPI000FFE9A08|nr:hypothetical protein [Pseudomonas aeruginosa]MBN0887219.1 hypothetical protein [Pseudomonas aeruginosa]MBN7870210.1 hypothetical protein [Pseudomonas aeruginosa]HBN8509319.1 hypothetical protein [Pseudomonas aeruginosa]HBO3778431.1 hypothetical protein [Pseudomonas aeruginosa]